jgi:hypothetical protein
MKPIEELYKKLTEQDYVSQTEVLNLYPEYVPRDDILLQLFKLEQDGLIYANRERKEIVYFLASVVRH